MYLHKEILNNRSKENVMKAARYACSSTKRFSELVDCVVSNEKRLPELASWCLGWAVKLKPLMVLPHLETVVAQMENEAANETVKRNMLRILEDVDIPENFHGRVMNACFRFVEDPATAVAIKAFSLTILSNLSRHYPDILPELKLLIEARMPHETAAFRSRGRKILRF
jgi:hypothetical protein